MIEKYFIIFWWISVLVILVLLSFYFRNLLNKISFRTKKFEHNFYKFNLAIRSDIGLFGDLRFKIATILTSCTLMALLISVIVLIIIDNHQTAALIVSSVTLGLCILSTQLFRVLTILRIKFGVKALSNDFLNMRLFYLNEFKSELENEIYKKLWHEFKLKNKDIFKKTYKIENMKPLINSFWLFLFKAIKFAHDDSKIADKNLAIDHLIKYYFEFNNGDIESVKVISN